MRPTSPTMIELPHPRRRAGLHVPARSCRRRLPRPVRRRRDRPRSRPGVVHEPRRSARAEHRSDRSSSATSIPTTSSISSRSATTFAGTSDRSAPRRRPRAVRAGPTGSTPSTTSPGSRRRRSTSRRSAARRAPPRRPARSRPVGSGHTDDSYAFRVSAGRSDPGLVYSGDCGDADGLRPLLRPGDTLLSEASYGADPVADGVGASQRARRRSARRGRRRSAGSSSPTS